MPIDGDPDDDAVGGTAPDEDPTCGTCWSARVASGGRVRRCSWCNNGGRGARSLIEKVHA